jgi:mannose/fructose/N-acetylgalactosamine-specific phosphotransferase system component IIC
MNIDHVANIPTDNKHLIAKAPTNPPSVKPVPTHHVQHVVPKKTHHRHQNSLINKAETTTLTMFHQIENIMQFSILLALIFSTSMAWNDAIKSLLMQYVPKAFTHGLLVTALVYTFLMFLTVMLMNTVRKYGP